MASVWRNLWPCLFIYQLYPVKIPLLNDARPTNSCYPFNSTVDPRMKTINNKSCYFPFIYQNIIYNDCVPYGTTRQKFCPNTCNLQLDYEYSFCQWERKNLEDETCSNLTKSQPGMEPLTLSNQMCMFPFVYKGRCFDDCITMDSHQLWCGNTSSVDLYPDQFLVCLYDLKSLRSPGCENTTYAKPEIHPDNTGNNSLCVFPFIYNGKCYNECIDQNENDYWCSFSKGYINNRWAYCRYLRNFDQYESGLKYGIYEIYANCSHSPICEGKVFGMDQRIDSSIHISRNNSLFLIGTWEVLPQPNKTVIIRTPKFCSTSNSKQLLWTFSNGNKLVLGQLQKYKQNMRFTLLPHQTFSDVFSLFPTVSDTSDPQSFVGFQSSVFDTRYSVSLEKIILPLYWRFELLRALNNDGMEDNCSALASPSIPISSTSVANTEININREHVANNIQGSLNALRIIIYVTIGISGATFISTLVFIVVNRNRNM